MEPLLSKMHPCGEYLIEMLPELNVDQVIPS